MSLCLMRSKGGDPMTTTQHPERRAGQRYKDRFGVVYVLTRPLDGERWESRSSMGGIEFPLTVQIGACHWLNLALIADAPPVAPKVDRAGCSWHCGMRMEDILSNHPMRLIGQTAWLKSEGATPTTGIRWCSSACRLHQRPPLELKPAETGKQDFCCHCGTLLGNRVARRLSATSVAHEDCCMPAETIDVVKMRAKCGKEVGVLNDGVSGPSWLSGHEAVCAKCKPPVPEAPKAIGPVCRLKGIEPHVCDGAVATRIMRGLPVGLYCEQAYRTREASITQLTRNTTGTPYAGPERIAKPKLAVDWIWDTLPDGSR